MSCSSLSGGPGFSDLSPYSRLTSRLPTSGSSITPFNVPIDVMSHFARPVAIISGPSVGEMTGPIITDLQKSFSGSVAERIDLVPPAAPSLWRTRTVPVTAAEACAAANRMRQVQIPLKAWQPLSHDERSSKSGRTPYQEGARAAGEAEPDDWDDLHHDQASVRSKDPRHKVLRRHLRPRVPVPSLTTPLPDALRHSAAQPAHAMQSIQFRSLQAKFQERYALELHQAFGPGTCISAAPVHRSVQRSFLDRLARDSSSEVRLGYHGTREDNFGSIFQNGFIIPGQGNIRVENGSVHGLGIYTARLGAATLSQGFADSDKMLVCGVIDKPDELSFSFKPKSRMLRIGRAARQPDKPAQRVELQADPRMMGSLMVHRESAEVRHVGDAQVIFNEECVVPLLRVENLPDSLYQDSFQRRDWCSSDPMSLGASLGITANGPSCVSFTGFARDRLNCAFAVQDVDLGLKRACRGHNVYWNSDSTCIFYWWASGQKWCFADACDATLQRVRAGEGVALAYGAVGVDDLSSPSLQPGACGWRELCQVNEQVQPIRIGAGQRRHSKRSIESHGAEPNPAAPLALKIASCPTESWAGTYHLQLHETGNGQPTWKYANKHRNVDYWLYFGTHNRWGIGDEDEKELGFDSCVNYVRSDQIFGHPTCWPHTVGLTEKYSYNDRSMRREWMRVSDSVVQSADGARFVERHAAGITGFDMPRREGTSTWNSHHHTVSRRISKKAWQTARCEAREAKVDTASG